MVNAWLFCRFGVQLVGEHWDRVDGEWTFKSSWHRVEVKGEIKTLGCAGRSLEAATDWTIGGTKKLGVPEGTCVLEPTPVKTTSPASPSQRDKHPFFSLIHSMERTPGLPPSRLSGRSGSLLYTQLLSFALMLKSQSGAHSGLEASPLSSRLGGETGHPAVFQLLSFLTLLPNCDLREARRGSPGLDPLPG